MNELKSDINENVRQHSSAMFWIPIIESYFADKTALPPYLGLGKNTFYSLCKQFHLNSPPHFIHETEKRQIISELANLRMSEQQDLKALLINHTQSSDIFTEEMSVVISAACMGTQHLWKDLGMPERPLLTQLFGFFYPELRAINNRNMRWKRFLYRQLCSSGGDYVCRAPSCETCTSFDECFADD